MRMLWLTLLLMMAPPAMAAPRPDSAIAAVVGSEAISAYDVGNRLKFVIISSGLPDTPEAAQRLRPQVLRALIDERLELKEAAAFGISVSDQDVAAAVADIEKDRGMKPGAIFALLDKNNLPHDTFTSQIRAQLAWRQFVIKRIRPGVRVSDEEVALMGKLPAVSAAAQEFKIAVLTLPVDKPDREKEMARLARKLVGDIRKGASFEEISRQFTGSKGESFWVRPGQLDPAAARILATASAGTVTDPVRTQAGYVIIKIHEARALGGDKPAPEPDAARIRNVLFQQKIELEAQKYLRNLRRDTFIEVR